MDRGALRRSSRPRGPPKDAFAEEFIGDQWKQMRCDPKKLQNQSDKNGASLEGNEQIKLELACVMQQLDACRENISSLSKRKSNVSSVKKSTDQEDALPIDFEIDCWNEQMFDCTKKINALNTQLLRFGDLSANGASTSEISDCIPSEHYGVPTQPSKVEGSPLEGLQTKRAPAPFIYEESTSLGPNLSRGPTDSSPCITKKFTDLFKANHVQKVSLESQSKGGECAEDKSSIREEDIKEVSLDFVPHGPRNENFHLKIPSELIDEGKKEWQSTLVGHFVGKKKNPPYTIVSKTTERLWGNKGLIDTLGNSGFYFFTFSSVEERDAVLEGGPWYIWGQPLILSPWKPNLKLNKEEIHAIPIWVNLFGIPLELWNRKGISFIASYLGKPLRMDRVTANRRRVSYARVCVEVSGAHDLITKFALETEDEMGGVVLTDITVEYQWTPPRCAKCSAFGHDCSRDVTPRPVPARRNFRRHPPHPSFHTCSYNKAPEIGEWVVVKGKGKGKLVDPVEAPRSEGNMFSVLSPDVEQGPSQSEVVVCPLEKELGMATPSHHPSTGFDTGPEASSSPLDEGCEVSEYDYEEDPPVVKSIASNRQMKLEAKIKFSGNRPKGRHRN